MNTEQLKTCYAYNQYKRVHYFYGMLLSDRDFQEQEFYDKEKRKLHNRMLHGWGVVCGLGVKAECHPSSKVIITPGMALDCLGNEIVVDEAVQVDLGELIKGGINQQACGDPNTDSGYYIAIKYHEIKSDPVLVYGASECEEKKCDHSRTREGFGICLLNYLPSKTTIAISRDAGDPYPCQSCDCTENPYVVLGKVTMGENNQVNQICFEGRPWVITPMLCAAVMKMQNGNLDVNALLKEDGKAIAQLLNPECDSE